jgi:hypothetical protein
MPTTAQRQASSTVAKCRVRYAVTDCILQLSVLVCTCLYVYIRHLLYFKGCVKVCLTSLQQSRDPHRLVPTIDATS